MTAKMVNYERVGRPLQNEQWPRYVGPRINVSIWTRIPMSEQSTLCITCYLQLIYNGRSNLQRVHSQTELVLLHISPVSVGWLIELRSIP
jgi:hypothetical protein